MERNYSFTESHFPASSTPANDMPFGRLIHYTVQGLFGVFTHTFHLERDEPTILTGANGTGKSTILRTIHLVSQGKWDELAKITFEKIRLHFEFADIIIVSGGDNLTIRYEGLDSPRTEWTYSDKSDLSAREIHALQNMLVRAQIPEENIDWARDSYLREVAGYLASGDNPKRPEWVAEISESFLALLVSDRRLTDNSRRVRAKKRGQGETIEYISAIEAAFSNVDEEVQRARSAYASVSQEMDRNFPKRVLHAMRTRDLRGEEGWLRSTQRNFEKLVHLQRGLSDTGLVHAAEIEYPFSDITDETTAALPFIHVYLEDTLAKLRTFQPLRERLDPFITFLRRHYRNKKIAIQDGHLRIESSLTEEEIHPTHLSSGEQQILILAHKVLFETAPGTLLMIDEPELSLHVLWQATFIDDLTEMSSVTGCQFLLATHSPTLIAGRNDLRRSLDG
ncbi:AAA family ATPase [Streptomyces werraensis]|uniref:AAA family ATPase n=1 Tax=Streptomyces werraensis TaxID=68284 RepID=UPI0036F5A9A1